MKKIFSLFISNKTTLVALFAFAISMAVATFIENDYGTATARSVIYNAWWFEVLMLILAINFISNIFKYKLLQWNKLPILTFHIGFIIILIGAAVTRYTAYEGVLRVRENSQTNIIISDKNFIQVKTTGEDTIQLKKEKYFSPIQNNSFEISQEVNQQQLRISFNDFIPDASETLATDTINGKAILEIVISKGNGKETFYLETNDSIQVGDDQYIVFNNPKSKNINLSYKDDHVFINSPIELSSFNMAAQIAGMISRDTIQKLQMTTLYRGNEFSFVPVNFQEKGTYKLTSQSKKPKDNDKNIPDILVLNVSLNDQSKQVKLTYNEGYLPKFERINFNHQTIELGYGAIPVEMPFSLFLEDFKLERYPGSTSPSAYTSEINVLDNGQVIPQTIFMNNVLDYKGYRFFQASYDSDEKGTVLAVNHDRPGTIITYIGYFLMGLGMFLTLFGKSSRFTIVRQQLKKLNNKTSIFLILVLLGINSVFANSLDSIIQSQIIDQQHAGKFGRLMVQDLDGRIKPINTLASEFLRKVSRKPYYKYKDIKLDANQVFLAIESDPITWAKVPLIKIDPKKGGPAYQKLATNKDNLISFEQLIDSNEGYILEKYVKQANLKKPAERSEFDKEVLKTDERFNILFNLFSGNYLKIFPKRNDKLKTWYSFVYGFRDFPEEDAAFAKGIIPTYFTALEEAKKTGDYSIAENHIAYIQKYQQVLASDIIPSPRKIEAEIWYNRLNLYYYLFPTYWFLGLISLCLAIARIFSKSNKLIITYNVLSLFTFIVFLIQTGYLILRWYVAEHAPWSNGYEMITFVSWAIILFGLIFYKKSDFTLPLATLFTGTLIFVSYLDWLNPEITNLMPVLKSYWLKIHVATIISSYAPLALSAILGLMVLILMIIKNKNNGSKIDIKIKELTYINELSMTIGLFTLSIGTFLGGVWANESWGRYWAWDPKETWALISIIIYAVVLHLRLVPSLRGKFLLNVASIFAFYSIIMTSFGVNYYLTGLHSYATGDPVPIPSFAFYLTGFIIIISILAGYKSKNFGKQQ